MPDNISPIEGSSLAPLLSGEGRCVLRHYLRKVQKPGFTSSRGTMFMFPPPPPRLSAGVYGTLNLPGGQPIIVETTNTLSYPTGPEYSFSVGEGKHARYLGGIDRVGIGRKSPPCFCSRD